MGNKSLLVLLLASLFILLPWDATAQRKEKHRSEPERASHVGTSPKLVVGIVVDQMRYDYITRFWDQFGDGGFRRLANEGYNCRNNHFNYVPTFTAPGHASVYTGTTPATHGIIGNDWYDKESGKEVYCVEDGNYRSVGTTSGAGQMSPHRLETTTITDQLRLHTNMRGKVIAISLKDRAAVLPGGHIANAAYWFQGGDEGNWISSSFYMSELPKWVRDFNAAKSVSQYKKPWNTLKNINDYVVSIPDNNKYEGLFKGENAPVFPHDLPSLWMENGQYSLLKSTPFGNSLTVDFALVALDAEKLGEDDITDFLAVSFSSTDYVGHMYGVASKEVEDTYLRLDKDLERLLDALDKKVGKGEYTLFLTADHAAVNVPQYLKDLNVVAGYMDAGNLKSKLKEFAKFTFGTDDLIRNISNFQVFLDHKVMYNLDLSPQEVEETLAKELLGYSGVYRVYTGYQMWHNGYTEGMANSVQNGFNQKRSGDVIFVMSPATLTGSRTGTSHGSPFSYDTHVPLLFYGKGIQTGNTVKRTVIPDIAPTIAALLGIEFPSGTTGVPISEVLK
ncbi:alkaline phosphatase family protein [Flavobacteriaceae bacterium F89]|uniref:Alkaline phosphatase family protein n=1 Tax=Cerina litoralis TaxID=2874477 RepID=A0AAE3EVB2_9FLAO|nr:alkaline phosphatase PafA [Cerina litoralis]MCG2461727.1 alkaline phosphatase family protein [Cerina litoralis]